MEFVIGQSANGPAIASRFEQGVRLPEGSGNNFEKTQKSKNNLIFKKKIIKNFKFELKKNFIFVCLFIFVCWFVCSVQFNLKKINFSKTFKTN